MENLINKDSSIIGRKLNFLVSELIKNKIFDARVRVPNTNRDSSRILEVYGYNFLVEFNNNHRITKVSFLNNTKLEKYLDFSDNIWGLGKSKKIIDFVLSFICKHPDYSFLLKNI